MPPKGAYKTTKVVRFIGNPGESSLSEWLSDIGFRNAQPRIGLVRFQAAT
jgi:hypothetical protein